MSRLLFPLILVVALAAPIVAQDPLQSPADRHKEGHSKLGAAFDEGPRERPAKMAGMPIHSTILIDKAGRVHWARHGGGPFTDYDFLASQLQRMNALSPQALGTTAGR